MKEDKQGIINALIAFGLWGVYPLFWWLLQGVSPTELLINRMLWSFTTLLIVIIVFKKVPLLKETLIFLKNNKNKLLLVVLAAVLICINWFIFTYAIVSGRVLEVSLGYYINPLFNVMIGVFFLKEKLNKYQVLAIIIAFIGILYLSLSYGVLPWVSLILAVTFCFYGVVKKFVGIDSLMSLFLEMTLLLPISLFFTYNWIQSGSSIFITGSTYTITLILLTGIVTVSPLYFFAKAASKLQLKTLGFIQYIGPSLQMIMAITIIGEPFSTNRLITFIFIWIACLLFSTSHYLIKLSPLQLKKT